MIFIDFEVSKFDWLCVIINMVTGEEIVIHNDSDRFIKFYNEHKNDIWIGYNIRHYDQYILKSIVCQLSPKECNDFIIKKNLAGWMFSDLFRKVPLNIFDVMATNDRGLKACEGFMGNNIKETDVDFDIDRPWTDEELQQMIFYCRSDVLNTVEVFIERKNDFQAQMDLLTMFNMPLSYISKTKVQLSAEILEAEKHDWKDEFDIHIPDVAIVKKYTKVVDWFRNHENHHYKDGNNGHKLNIIMAGVPMVFGWGGVHGAKPKYHSKGYFINMDVGSLYPSIDCLYPEWCFSRSVPKEGLERYKWIKKYRLELKAQHKKKEQAPLKIVLNGTYGAMKDRNNKLYDPRSANNTCVFGQILVGVDLLERLEETGVCEIIQVNTDGILIKMNRYEDYDLIDDVAAEWEQRTGLDLEFDDYGWGEIYQKDVNNYVIIDGYDGHFKSKGAYVKELNRLDYDLPIVNKAMVGFMTQNIPVEKTILECDDLKEFQMIRKITNKYSCIKYGSKTLSEKCVRIFASKDVKDAGMTKIHTETGRPEKLNDSPEHCFIFNESVEGVKCPQKLDKQFYIRMTKERLKGFGVEL